MMENYYHKKINLKPLSLHQNRKFKKPKFYPRNIAKKEKLKSKTEVKDGRQFLE